MRFITDWTFWLWSAAWAPYALCLLFYGLRSPWRSSPVGRALFTLYAALTAVLTLVLAVRVFDIPDVPRTLLAVLMIGAVSVAGFIQLVTILRLQRCREGDHPRRRITDRRI